MKKKFWSRKAAAIGAIIYAIAVATVVVVNASVTQITPTPPTFTEGDTAETAGEKDLTLNFTFDTSEETRVEFTLDGAAAGKFYLYDPATGEQGESIVADIGPSSTPDSTSPSAVSPGAVTELTASYTIKVGINPGETLALDDKASVIVNEVLSDDPVETVDIVIEQKVVVKNDIIVRGTVRVYNNSSPIYQNNATVTITGGTTANVIGTVVTKNNGAFTYTIPKDVAQANVDGGLNVTVVSYFYPGWNDTLLTADGSAAEGTTGRNIPIVADMTVDEQYYDLVHVMKVEGLVKDRASGSPISDVKVSSFDSVMTTALGEFTLQTPVSLLNNETHNYGVFAYHSEYYDYSVRVPKFTLDDFKAGIKNIGTINLDRKPTGGMYPSPANSLLVTPNTVVPLETSQGVLTVKANAAEAQKNVTIEITAFDGGLINRATKPADISVTKDGVKANIISSVSWLQNKLTLKVTQLDPNVEYKFAFSVSAPADGSVYTVESAINGTLTGRATVVIHAITITAPPEISPGELFNAFGDVIFDSSVDVRLNIYKDGKEYTEEQPSELDEQSVQVSPTKGWHYKFTDLKLTDEGYYTIVAESYRGDVYLATATTRILVTSTPLVLKTVEISDVYNKQRSANPAPGDYITFMGWVDQNLNSMDYRKLQTATVLNTKTGAQDGQFLLKTSIGTYVYPTAAEALKSATFGPKDIKEFQGSGKAEIVYEVTKTDGTILDFTVAKLVILMDPSGYVYDRVTGEKIEGAEVTLYYDDGGNWVKWEAENFDQINDQLTNDLGEYGWMVPEGVYRVEVNAEGYETAYSDDGDQNDGEGYELVVLPPQLGVNIALNKIDDGSEPGGPSVPNPSIPGLPGGSYGLPPAASAPSPSVTGDSSTGTKPVYTVMLPTRTAGTKLICSATTNSFVLNGKTYTFAAAVIDSYNWIKLRDLAYLLNGTKKQFSVGYDSATNTITIQSGVGYSPVGDELTTMLSGSLEAIASPQKIVFNGKTISVAAYNIKNYNYFRLRDIAILLDFNLIYSGAGQGTVTFDLDKSYTE